MTSLDIVSARKTIEDYIDGLDIPKEVVRMVVKEIYQKTEKDAYAEALAQAKEKENSDGN